MQLAETLRFGFIFSLDGKIIQAPVDTFDVTSRLSSTASRYRQPSFQFGARPCRLTFTLLGKHAGTSADLHLTK